MPPAQRRSKRKVERVTGPVDEMGYRDLVRQRFPEVFGSIDLAARGLIHLEVAALRRATQAAIDVGDAATIRDHFDFVNQLLPVAAPEVANALRVSYLEDLHFGGRNSNREQSLTLLPPRLRSELTKLNAYLSELFGQ